MRSQVLSSRERSLAFVAGLLLVVLVVIGYSRSSHDALTSVLVAQTGTSTSTEAASPAPAPPPPTNTNDIQNANNTYNDKKRTLGEWRKEVDRIKKDNAGASAGNIETLFANYEKKLNDGYGFIQKSDTQSWWSINQDLDSLWRDIDDAFKPLRDLEQWKNIEQNCKNQTREIDKDIPRQVSDIKKELARLKTLDAAKRDSSLANVDKYCGASLSGFSQQLGKYCSGRQGTPQDFWDLQSDVDPSKRDCYDALQEARELQNQSACSDDVARRLKEKDKNLIKEYQRLSQKIGESNVPIALKSAYDGLMNGYVEAEKLLATDCESARDTLNDSGTYQQDFWEAFNEVNQLKDRERQLKDVRRELQQRTKEVKNMEREYARFLKENKQSEAPALRAAIDGYAKLLGSAEEQIQSDPQVWWHEIQPELNDIQNEFWNSMNSTRQIRDAARWMGDLEREVANREKEIKQVQREGNAELAKSLTAIYNKMKSVLNEAVAAFESDPQDAQDILHEFESLRWEWDQMTQSFHQGRQARFMVEEFEREVEHAVKFLKQAKSSGRLSADEYQVCIGFVDEARAILERNRDNLEEFEDAMDDLEERAERACPIIEEMDETRRDRDYYEEFVGEHFDDRDIDQRIAADVLERISGNIAQQVLQRLLGNTGGIGDLLNAAGERNRDAVARSLESTTALYDEQSQREVLAQKAQILELTQKLEELQGRLKIAAEKLASLQKIQDEIAAYNFYGDGGDEIRTKIEEFVAAAGQNKLSESELGKRLADLQAKKDEAIRKSIEEKFRQKIIPFKDTDDNQWFTTSVKSLAEAGIVRGKGDGTSYDPGSHVTVAEIITMAFRVSGDSEPSEDSALCKGKYTSHWGNRFIRWAENRGASLVKGCDNPDRRALRWEVVNMLLEATGQPIEPTSEKCFNDVDPRDKAVNAVVCKAKAVGILSGSNGNAKPYDPINRAEAAAVVKAGGEKLFSISFQSTASSSDAQQTQRPSAENKQEFQKKSHDQYEKSDGSGSQFFPDDVDIDEDDEDDEDDEEFEDEEESDFR